MKQSSNMVNIGKINIRMSVARFLVGIVLFVNLQAGMAFLINPVRYAPGFELNGPVGKAAVQGYGLLFLMWIVPYLVAFINPIKYKVALYQAGVMQAIGFFGEIFIKSGVPLEHQVLHASITRFILFDGLGLVGLLLALLITSKLTESQTSSR